MKKKVSEEEKTLIRMILSLHLDEDSKILDLGCGFGDKLRLLVSRGYDVTGIDINPDTVKTNSDAGMKCMIVDDFKQTRDLYDVLIMSHVIEHFNPPELIKFVDDYLGRLKVGGHLLVATPLFSPYFYDDFDHVKPYHPSGINAVFGNRKAQVQYYSEHTIELIDIWFRKEPFRLHFFPCLYLRKNYSRTPMLLNLILKVLFHGSFGLIGRTNGWMGLYRKIA